jgi:hypothetical protein
VHFLRGVTPLAVLAGAATVFATPRASTAPTVPPEIVVCDTTGGRTNASIVADGQGGAIVAWTDARGGGFDVYAHHVLAEGRLDPVDPRQGEPVCTAINDQSVTTLIGDGQGGAFVAWIDGRGGVDHDVYTARLDAHGIPWTGWAVQGVALCTAIGHQHGLDLVSDGGGGAIGAWFDFRAGADAHIYAQHVTAPGIVDTRWPADGLPVCAADGAQYFPRVVGDGKGGAIVAWYDKRNGSNYDVYAQHVLATGMTDSRWPANGRALCTAAGDQRNPTIVSDGHGGGLVAWMDLRRPRDPDVYAQRVLASGAVDPKWPADGLAVCSAPGRQDAPVLVSDGAGGAIAAWIDARSSYDLYTQHVLVNGALDRAWPSEGLPVCTAAGDKGSPAIAADGAGGAFVTWQDRRNGSDFDLYVQHVLGSGVPDHTWPAEGRLVSGGPGDQARPSIARLGANGCGLAWEDTRHAPAVEIRAVLLRGTSATKSKPTSGKRRSGSPGSAH